MFITKERRGIRYENCNDLLKASTLIVKYSQGRDCFFLKKIESLETQEESVSLYYKR